MLLLAGLLGIPPLLSFECSKLDRLQSTTLQAVLPKLHLNRNTARSIIHGPAALGGLSLPHIHTLQGIDKLYLFLGHLRIRDRTAQLLHSDLSYLQLLTGSGSLCLNLSIADYQWVEKGWLTSLWDYVNTVHLQFIYPALWLPPLPRAGDAYLMEQFLQLKLPNNTLARLNRCRLYLQVITISDLTSADGSTILPAAKQGTLIEERPSGLRWPSQGLPTRADWRLWSNTLSQFENNGRLLHPLGEWRSPTHQKWQYFIHLPTQEVYHVADGFIPRRYRPIITPAARTRSQMRPWYDHHRSQPVTQPPHPLHPVTLDYDAALTGSLFQVNFSSNSLIVSLPPPSPQCYLDLAAYFADQPPPLSDILDAMSLQTLTVVCSSNYNRDQGLATSTCSFISHGVLYEYESLPMQSTTRLRAEFFSVLIGLYIVHTAENFSPQSGPLSVTITSNSKSAVTQAFDPSPIGIRTAVRPHYDLLLEIQHYRRQLHTSVKAYHSPVTNGGVPAITSLAPPLLQVQRLSPVYYVLRQTPISHVITALYRGEPLVTSIKLLVEEVVYRIPLQVKLQKDNSWTDEQFLLVDWEAYKHAFRRQPRSHRVSIAKLSHQLWNTNVQNCKFYGQSDLCPYRCGHSETLSHMFTCTQPDASAHRTTALTALQSALAPFTPSNLLETLMSGIS